MSAVCRSFRIDLFGEDGIEISNGSVSALLSPLVVAALNDRPILFDETDDEETIRKAAFMAAAAELRNLASLLETT